MKKRLSSFVLLFTVMLFTALLKAQSCPTGVTTPATATTTSSTCSTGGTINVTSTNTGSGVLYLLYASTDTTYSNPLSSNNTGVFSNVLSGTYTVRVVCEAAPTTIYRTYTNVTVGSSYTPISSTITAATCTNYTAGGTITATNVAGGSGTYEYKFVQASAVSNNPNFADTVGTYQSGSSFVTPATSASYGTWYVRIRDAACPGNFNTFSYNLQPALRPIASFSPQNVKNTSTCTTASMEINGWVFRDSSGNQLSGWETLGMIVKVYEGTAGSGTTCSKLNNTVIAQQTINSFAEWMSLPITSTGNYYFEVTSPCGDTYSKCWTTPTTPGLQLYVQYDGCTTTPQMAYIQLGYDTFIPYPVSVTVTDASGNTVWSNPVRNYGDGVWITGGLPVGTYTVTYSNPASCFTLTRTINIASIPTIQTSTINASMSFYNACDSGTPPDYQKIEGTSHIRIAIGNGYGSVLDGQYFVIMAAPDPLLIGKTYNFSGGYTDINNVVPGTYTFRLWNKCGQYKDFTVNLTTTQLTNVAFTQNYVNACTPNSGTITWSGVFQYIYTGTTPMMQLVNTATGAVAYSQPYANSGTFVNVADGTYQLRLMVGNSTCSPPYYYYPDNAANITISSSVAPQIISAVSMICEDAGGNPLSTGNVYLNIGGSSPFIVEYTLQGAAYPAGVIGTTNNVTADYSVSGLTPGQTYTFYVTDKCGNRTSLNVTIQPLQNLTLQNNVQPCYNQPYLFAMRYYAGATYQITNPAGTVISNTRTYSFSNYTAANDGVYTVTVNFGSCLVRTFQYTLNGALCGQPITNDACYKDPALAGTALPTVLGVTAFSRAGKNNGDVNSWPMVRKGGFIALESSTKGFVITRTSHTSITNPVLGMMIYCTTDNCIEIYTANGWKCFDLKSCPDLF